MENDINIVVEATEALKASSKGRYLDNIAKLCQTKHGWSEDTTRATLDEAIKKNRIQTSIVNNKISYRKFDDKKICIEDDCETNATQTDPLPLNDFVTKDQLDKVQNDFIEFKRFSNGEILPMKAEVANRGPNPKVKTNCDHDREALVRYLHERIISLEKQLQDKQFIIEKLLEGQNRPAIPLYRQAIPSVWNRRTSSTMHQNKWKTILETNG
eukprot:Seg5319.2 transcript_id=Seg5319.2/GoldUCD/mRNA.D3Y31 product="hypothetical protein" protein_id=Seg5319.2/GoldUCD/D3Y31